MKTEFWLRIGGHTFLVKNNNFNDYNYYDIGNNNLMIMTIFRSTLTIDTNDCNNNDNDNDKNNIRSTVCSQDD